jgi:hypothetical protein
MAVFNSAADSRKQLMQKPHYKLSSMFGLMFLVIVVAVIAWAAFGGISGCGTGCNPVSGFGLRFGH